MMHEFFDNKMLKTIEVVKDQFEDLKKQAKMHVSGLPEGKEKAKMQALLHKIETGKIEQSDMMKEFKNMMDGIKH